MVCCDLVIVNWNAGEFLKKCIDAILNSNSIDFIGEIFIIDNASTDESIRSIQGLDKIRIIKNTENVGFGAACNQGIALSNAPYVVMVNPDVVVFENTISDSISFMESNSQIDIMGGMQLDETNKIMASCARFPSPLNFFYDATGLSKILPQIFHPATLMTDWSHAESRKVDQIIGSYMFIRRSVFEKVGVFDPVFFVYYEELDLSKRLRDADGISFYNHNIKLRHYGEGTTKNVKGYRLYLNLKSRLLYAKKHFGNLGFFVTYISTLIIEPFSRIAILLLQRRYADIKSTYSGFKSLWKEWKIMLFPPFSAK